MIVDTEKNAPQCATASFTALNDITVKNDKTWYQSI